MPVDPAVAAVLEGLSASLPERPDLTEALDLISRAAHQLVPGCIGASITIRSSGTIFSIAASDALVEDLDDVQYTGDGGPCVSALETGQSELVQAHEDLRWPAFVGLAQARNVQTILSVPLVAGPRTVGVLNIYGDERLPSGHEIAQEIARRAADSVALLHLYEDSVILAGRLARALEIKDVVDRARGMLMGREGLSAAAAFDRLTRSAAETGDSLHATAVAVLAEGPP